jgi:DNA-binding NtrC family response regulator
MLFTDDERAFARAVSRLAHSNPFLPERLEAERDVLGDDFDPASTWQPVDGPDSAPNVVKIGARVGALAERVRERLGAAASDDAEDFALYEDLVAYLLFERYEVDLFDLIKRETATVPVERYREFVGDHYHFLGARPGAFHLLRNPAHLLATFFQVRRAFHHIHGTILGASAPAVRLRAAVWQSVFTHDPRRYRRGLHERMGDIATLITGPSGTGKELVARAIGLSRYIPFNPTTQTFAEEPAAAFFPLNLSALSPTLVESELFGHRRGAFTGALTDRKGWFEVCPPLGTVFLDEIGEVEPAIQVKLLRVLQTRTFQRLGDTTARRFEGKIIAATNRDLAAAIAAGHFREDFYYRLCADVIVTPSLAEQLQDAPDELPTLVDAIARRVAGDAEAEGLAAEAERWIRQNVGPEYPWPGNVRELEQCVRNVMIRGSYQPPAAGPRPESHAAFVNALLDGALTADEVLRRYCTLVYARTRNYLDTARRLGIDRRTVRAKVDPAMLAELDGGGAR